jgi:hypothetical protein
VHPGARLSDRDRELLAFIAEHRFVLPAHAEALLGGSYRQATARLRALSDAGYLIEQPLFAGQPATYRSTRLGLTAIGSELSSRRINLASNFDHEIGAAWLWLAARNGAFGPMRDVLGERRLRSHDAKEDRPGDPFGVRLGGVGPQGRERLHYPDLLLVDHSGRRIAIELELSSKQRTRREGILAGYAADGRIAAVLYVAYTPQIARAVSRSASRLGISWLIHVKRVRPPAPAPRAPQRGRASERPAAGRALELSR